MPITRRSFALGAPLAAAAATLARPAIADSSPILIGYPAALTGPSSAPGVAQNRGVTYAVEMINAAGGIKGRKIEMVTRDTQGDPTKAVNAVQEMMANNKVHAIWGPNNSGEALATTPIITRRGIPNIHSCGITSLIDEKKFPNAFRITPNNDQSAAPPTVYAKSVLHLEKVAVVGDSTGYGTSAVIDSVKAYKEAGIQVAYQAQIDATQPDMMPDMLRMRASGAQAVSVWTVSPGMTARLLNARATMGWDVPFVGHQSMGSGEVGQLLDKPANWDKVFIIGYKQCSLLPSGKLPDRTQAFVDQVKGKIALADTSLWWIVSAVDGFDAVNLVAKAVDGKRRRQRAKDDHQAIGMRCPANIQELFGDLHVHAGPITTDILSDDARHVGRQLACKNGSFRLAPGYT